MLSKAVVLWRNGCMPEKGENIKYCLYARKSTESEEKQVLSIDAQVKEMKELAEKEGLNVTEVKTESHSAKAVGQRPIFNKMIEEIKEGKYSGVLTWAPDRLSRNAGDLGALVDLMDQDVLRVVQTHGQRFSDSPSEKFLLMIMGSQAKLENDQKSKNVKRGLRARVEQGLWPAPAPTGYLKHPNRDKKCHVVVDKERAPVIKKVFEKMAHDGWSGRRVHEWLKQTNFRTKNGKHLTLSNIFRMIKLDFYYGRFEYPKESGNWYDGVHEPIITKELFDRVQEQLESRRQYEDNNKEFAFTRLMKCGSCGSGITAQEKFKNCKDGRRRYVYYSCTKSRDKNCSERYIRENELTNQLINLIDEIDVVKSGLEEKLKEEMKRFEKFQKVFGNESVAVSVNNVNVRNYAKYILENGAVVEKRDVMSCLKSRLRLTNRKIILT